MNRSIKDANGSIVFDPFGGGAYRRRLWVLGDKRIVGGGHVWFPIYERVAELLEGAGFSSVSFLHYYDENSVRGTRLVVQSLCGLGLVGRGPL